MLPLAISLGDPAGIGPEVTAKALKRFMPPGGALLFGRAAKVRMGRPSALSGKLAFDNVLAAAAAVRQGAARGLVTAPISKEAWSLAGLPYPGHTELLASLAGLKPTQVGMMLVGGGLRVFLVTRHLSLQKALRALNTKALDLSLDQCARGLRQLFGIQRPRIALAALNPHGGEAGLLGQEEKRLLTPWVQRRSKSTAYALSGPVPADTVFVQAVRGAYDAVLCLYHDQGLIPLKLLAFESGVNVTLGLPYVRTSPDHGTAFAIAGKGKADPGSMIAALKLADQLSRA